MLTAALKENICWVLLALALFIFSRNLSVHGAEYRDDEIFYFKSAQEMLTNHNYLSPTYFGKDRFEKPILFYWLVMFSYRIFGINWFAARFVGVLFAALTVCATYLLTLELFKGNLQSQGIRRFKNGSLQEMAVLSSVILMTSPLFLRHAREVVPDMPFNSFIVWALYFGVKHLQEPLASKNSFFFFICCALGFMIKGFAALVVPVGALCIYALMSKEMLALRLVGWARGWILFLFIVLPWFMYMTSVHGTGYFHYMVIEETKNRLVLVSVGNPILNKLQEIFGHAIFYMRTIFAYYLPWSVFLLLAIPLAFKKCGFKAGNIYPLKFLFAWLLIVIGFFSFMSFRITHYMLVLSAPLAIVVGYFFLNMFSENQTVAANIEKLKKIIIIVLLLIGILAYSFLVVFLAHKQRIWLLFISATGFILYLRLMKQRKGVFYPFLLGGFLLWINAQTSLLTEAGLTPHATLQKFAQTINAHKQNDEVVGVGSNDIHEKEFQVFFDQLVIKAANDETEETRQTLKELFNTPKGVYCLITAKDFYAPLVPPEYHFDIIEEEYMIRKRMAIDKGFFVAVLKFDRQKVRDYLMEKILLIKKS